jgi:hypothetical protein
VVIGDLRRAKLRALSTNIWMVIVAGIFVVLFVTLQITAMRLGFQGPLHSLISDYVATPVSGTAMWAGLGLAMVGVTNRYRVRALSLAAAIDVVFAGARLLLGEPFSLGNGPLIVLTGLAVWAWLRWSGEQRTTALRGVALGALLIVATKAGDAWLKVTATTQPTVLDEYVLLADHSLAQPSWLVGRVLDAAGSVPSGVLHLVYIELSVAAMAVAIYQLRNVTRGEWPQHYLVRTFLVLGLIGPVFYVLFPVVGPVFAFGEHGYDFRIGDYWPHTLPTIDLLPGAIPFDDETPRNCMPSMHTAWALAIFIHSRGGPRWLRWAGAFWLWCTIAATLGFGYHYGVDLIAGVVFCLTVESALRQPERGWDSVRIGMVGGGATLFAMLLLGYRYLAVPMAQLPLLFGPLMIGLMALYCVAFYAVFFARPGTVLARWVAATTWWQREKATQATALQASQPQPDALSA